MNNIFSSLSSLLSPAVKNRLAQATGWTAYPSQQPNQTATSNNLVRNAVGQGVAMAKGYSAANQVANRAMTPRVTAVKPPVVAATAYKPPTLPPVNQPPTQQPAAQPTAYDTYNQKYNAALQQSKARKEQEAAANKAENERQAQEQYDVNKGTYTTAKTNLDQLMSGFRDRIAAGDARLNQVANQNRERATTASGENQRQLAIDRRQALNDEEKRYAALGTLDSFGTGSFQSAVENKDSDFLRLTAKNKQDNEYALQEIDNKLFDAKASSQERLAVEEGKYNDAIAQIQTQLAGNEVDKARALRAAAMLYQQRTGEINDEFDSLSLAAEKEKADLQAKLQAASMDEQKLRSLFTSASPEFLNTGRPTTAEDQFLIFKYPKEAEAYAKILADGGGGAKANTEKQKLITLIDDISTSPNLGYATGLGGKIPKLPGDPTLLTIGQMNQLKALLSLENRQKLKGQGAISDREMGILERASSLLDQNLSQEQTKQVLSQLKNELTTGQPASINAQQGQVKMIAPDGQTYTVDQAEAQQAAQNGWKLAQ
jgi:hypothetical protein